MLVKVLHNTHSGLVRGGTFKELPPGWVALKLINQGIAEQVVEPDQSGGMEAVEFPAFKLTKRVYKPKDNTVSVYMATFPDRYEGMLKAVRSLIDQVDHVFLFCNNYTGELLFNLHQAIPDKKLKIYLSDDLEPATDIGCIGKFALMRYWNGYVLTADDDFEYPSDYVKKAIEAIDGFKRKRVICFHGRTIAPPIKSYWNDKVEFWQATQKVEGTHKCDILGTGVMALHTDLLTNIPDVQDIFSHSNSSDIYWSMAMKERDIDMMVIPHDANWIRWIPNHVSIGRHMKKGDCFETKLINDFKHWKQ